MGMALAPLRSQNVLLLGSGMSYHRMDGFARTGSSSSKPPVGQVSLPRGGCFCVGCCSVLCVAQLHTV